MMPPDEDLELEEELRRVAERLPVAFTEAGSVEASPVGGSMAYPPVRQPLMAQPQQAVAAPVETPAPAAQPDDMELAHARAMDRRARRNMAVERAGRELVAGLTRTPVQSVVQRPTDALQRLLAARAQKAQQASAAAGRDLSERRFAHQVGAEEDRVRRDTEKLEHDRKRQAALDERAASEKDEDQEITRQGHAASQANAAASRALAAAGLGMRQDEAAAKKTEREEKRGAGAVPLFDSTITLNPGLGDAERNKAREVAGLWNAADSATGELERALEAYVANPSRETAAAAQSAVATASTSLNAALGQGAMAEAEARRMQETLGADLFSPTGVEAAVKSFMGSPDAGKLLLTRLRSARQANRAAAKGRLRTYEAAQTANNAGRVSGGGDSKRLSEEDQLAVDWARSHPEDPRAQKILERNREP